MGNDMHAHEQQQKSKQCNSDSYVVAILKALICCYETLRLLLSTHVYSMGHQVHLLQPDVYSLSSCVLESTQSEIQCHALALAAYASLRLAIWTGGTTGQLVPDAFRPDPHIHIPMLTVVEVSTTEVKTDVYM